MTSGAVSKPIMFTITDQQLPRMDSKKMLSSVWNLNYQTAMKDDVAQTFAAAMLQGSRDKTLYESDEH